MVQNIVTAAALMLAVVPAPAASPPSASQHATALKTIATLHVSARCAGIVTHANSAIGATLDNDHIIRQTIAQLRLTNLNDGNTIHRRNALEALGDLAKHLMMQARSGDDEVKRLRKIAAQTKDPQEAKDLKAFADQLGGALWDQQRVARDLNGLLAYADFRGMTTFDESQKQIANAAYGVDDPFEKAPQDFKSRLDRHDDGLHDPLAMGHDPNQQSLQQQTESAADDFQNRLPLITRDENLAAGKIDPALKGC